MVTSTAIMQRGYAASARAKHVSSFTHAALAYFAASVDFAVFLTCSVVAVLGYHYIAFNILADPTQNIGIGLITATIFVLAMSCLRAYGYDELASTGLQVRLIVLIVPTVLAFLLAIVFFLKLGETYSRGAIVTLAFSSVTSLILIRVLWRHNLLKVTSVGWLRPKNAFFICPKAISEHDLQRLTQPGTRIARVDHLDDSHETPTLLRHRLSEATVWAGMDEIVIVWRDGPLAQLEAMLLELRSLPVSVKVIFDSFTGLIVAGRSESFGSATAFQVQSPPLGWAERATKRSFDIGFSLTAILCLSPMLLIVALAVKLDSTGPVFFRQRRLGYANQPFRIVKFRSMSVMEDSHDVRQATKQDPRITRVGAFIRASSIDELPQFWNVLRGEMSVVGPRPHAVAHDNIYDQLIVQYASRRYVKPGLTGWAQVMGSRGETPTVEAMEQRVAHDLWYIDNWSMWLDIKIVLRTALALRGA